MPIFNRNYAPNLQSQQQWLLDHGYYDAAYVSSMQKKWGDMYKDKIADGLSGENTNLAFNNAKAAGWNLDIDKFTKDSVKSSYSPNQVKGSVHNNKAYAWDAETQSWKPTLWCAQWANDSLRHYTDEKGRPRYTGDEISGHAWTRLGSGTAKMIYSGYDNNDYDRKAYSSEASNTRNHTAADNVKNNFNVNSLDKHKVYLVNMYYNGSDKKQVAWEDGVDGVTGTHTGNLFFNPNTNSWQISHNIHGKVYTDSYNDTLGGNNKKGYGVTAIAEAREKDYGLFSGITNFLKRVGIFETGGKLIPRFQDGDAIYGGTLAPGYVRRFEHQRLIPRTQKII
jgi:hypothetical protein